MKKKSQSGIELVVLVGALLVFFIILLGVFQQRMSEKSYERRAFAVRELALSVQNEIAIAAAATDGYQREFEILGRVGGADYSVMIVEQGVVYINTTDGRHAISLPVQNVTGEIWKGANVIQKVNGTVRLNPLIPPPP